MSITGGYDTYRIESSIKNVLWLLIGYMAIGGMLIYFGALFAFTPTFDIFFWIGVFLLLAGIFIVAEEAYFYIPSEYAEVENGGVRYNRFGGEKYIPWDEITLIRGTSYISATSPYAPVTRRALHIHGQRGKIVILSGKYDYDEFMNFASSLMSQAEARGIKVKSEW